MPKHRVKRHSVTQPIIESFRLIPLTQGQNAIVDANDFEWLSQWNWYARWDSCTKRFYAGRHGNIRMHRLILGCGPSEEGDHADGNSLNNRRYNLRKATDSQNSQNRKVRRDSKSGLKGVHWEAAKNRWVAFIRPSGKRKRLGSFSSKEDAAAAYDKAAIAEFGEFAHLNFPAASSRLRALNRQV